MKPWCGRPTGCVNYSTIQMTDFKSLGLSEALLKATDSMGFVNPTPIQEQAIPVLLQGDSDLVGLAQTGTGKTAAFGLPMLQLIDASARHPQGLILCPTRALCLQLTGDLQAFRSAEQPSELPS